jgi:hypothetical protein
MRHSAVEKELNQDSATIGYDTCNRILFSGRKFIGSSPLLVRREKGNVCDSFLLK